MCAAINRVDVVCKAEDRLGIGVVVLQSDFDRDFAAIRQFAVTLKVNGLVMQYRFAAVEVLDEFSNTAAIEKLFGTDVFAAFIAENNLQALVQERELAQTLGQCVEIERRGVHNRGIGLERDLRSRF